MAQFRRMSSESFSSARERLSSRTIGLGSILRDHNILSGVSRANVLLGLSAQSSTRSEPGDSFADFTAGSWGGRHQFETSAMDDLDNLKEEDVWPVENSLWHNAGKLNARSPVANDTGAICENNALIMVHSHVLRKAEGNIQKMRAAEEIRKRSEKGFGLMHHPLENGAISGLSTLSLVPDNASSPLFQVPSNVASPSWMIPPKADIPTGFGQPQSAPVSVPDWSKLIKADSTYKRNGIAENDGEDDEEEEQLPPHELIARDYARRQRTMFSVCEGQGRALKGRDLSRVRNAVWSKIGFAD